jgi:hypothetical protein
MTSHNVYYMMLITWLRKTLTPIIAKVGLIVKQKPL